MDIPAAGMTVPEIKIFDKFAGSRGSECSAGAAELG